MHDDVKLLLSSSASLTDLQTVPKKYLIALALATISLSTHVPDRD